MGYRKGVLDSASLVRTLAHGRTEGVRSTEGKSRTGAIPFRFLAQPVAGNAGVEIGKPEIGKPTHDGETRQIREDRR